MTGYVCLFLFTGCQSKDTLEDGTYMMRVTGVTDNTISGVVSQQKERIAGAEMGEMPQGKEPPQEGEMPTGDSGMTPPQDGELPSNEGKGGMIEEDSTEATLKINEQTKVSQGAMNQESQTGTLDDISEGAMVSVVVKNGLVTEINMFNMDRDKNGFDSTDAMFESEATDTI